MLRRNGRRSPVGSNVSIRTNAVGFNSGGITVVQVLCSQHPPSRRSLQPLYGERSAATIRVWLHIYPIRFPRFSSSATRHFCRYHPSASYDSCLAWAQLVLLIFRHPSAPEGPTAEEELQCGHRGGLSSQVLTHPRLRATLHTLQVSRTVTGHC